MTNMRFGLHAEVNEVAALIRRVCEESAVTRAADGPPANQGWYMRSLYGEEWFLSPTPEGWHDLVELMRALRVDDRIAANVDYDTLEDATVDAIFQAALSLRARTPDAAQIATDLIHRLTANVSDWFVVARVHGLDMAPGDSVSLAGLRLSRLTDREREDIFSIVRQVYATARLTPESEPGSAVPYELDKVERFLEGDNGEECWAWGVIPATAASADRLFYERLQVIALNILRCFAPMDRESPERVSLGEPPDAAVNKRLHYSVSAPVDTFTFGHSRFSDRHELVLQRTFLDYLSTVPAWTRAREISKTPPASWSDMEDAVFRAMLQFGTTTSSDVPEVRLAGYLTALEAMLLGENDYSNHDAKVGRRLSSLLNLDVRDEIADLYHVRQGPMHRAERSLGGRMTVLPAELDSLRFLTFQAIMAVLERTSNVQDRQSLLADLDQGAAQREPAPVSMTSYPFIARRSPIDGRVVVTCPDFPGQAGYGVSIRDAQQRARMAVDAEVRRRLEGAEQLPLPSSVEVNTVDIWTPSRPDDIGSYLGRADQLERQAHQRLLHMRGGSVPADNAACCLGIDRKELDTRRGVGRVIGLPADDGEYVYPVWQFTDQGTLPGLETVLAALGTDSPWAQAAFFLNRSGELPLPPLDLLRAGDIDTTLRAAATASLHGDAWFPIRPGND